jgi:hypothetical protein
VIKTEPFFEEVPGGGDLYVLKHLRMTGTMKQRRRFAPGAGRHVAGIKAAAGRNGAASAELSESILTSMG